MMHHMELTGDRKSFFIKSIFFLVLLVFVALLYFESKMVLDAVYFGIVLILFIKFLVVKLY